MTKKAGKDAKKAQPRPKLEKQTLRDLNPKGMADGVRGGRGPESGRTACVENEGPGTYTGS